jgi:hypothetical protein
MCWFKLHNHFQITFTSRSRCSKGDKPYINEMTILNQCTHFISPAKYTVLYIYMYIFIYVYVYEDVSQTCLDTSVPSSGSYFSDNAM